jgi:hypothetical protein
LAWGVVDRPVCGEDVEQNRWEYGEGGDEQD